MRVRRRSSSSHLRQFPIARSPRRIPRVPTRGCASQASGGRWIASESHGKKVGTIPSRSSSSPALCSTTAFFRLLGTAGCIKSEEGAILGNRIGASPPVACTMRLTSASTTSTCPDGIIAGGAISRTLGGAWRSLASTTTPPPQPLRAGPAVPGVEAGVNQLPGTLVSGAV